VTATSPHAFDAEPAFRFQELTKHFGQTTALAKVTFDVPAGSIFALVGPNGAGKTTLFSLAANFLYPDAGQVHMLGQDVTRSVASLRGRFSMLPQDAAFIPHMSAQEQIILFCRMAGMSRAESQKEAKRALDIVGLSSAAAKRTGHLSHGMLKRLAVSQAFLGSPEVIMLDEPTSGLDPENASNIRNLIRDMMGGQTVLISSHNLLELQDICTHCAILDKGRLVTSTTMSELLGGNQRVRLTLNHAPDDALFAVVRALPFVAHADLGDRGELVIDFTSDDEAARDAAVAELLKVLLANGRVPRTMQQGARLEERFLELVGARSDGLGAT